jgi:ABC-type Zn uptake system ZnuABC Zn-binding protein ZnuA
MSEHVKMIFKRALDHYAKVLEKLEEDKELDFSNDIFSLDIQSNINKIKKIADGLNSPEPDPQETLNHNRKLLCCSLQSYIEDLKKMKEFIRSKLQSSESSLPTIEFTNVDEEIKLAERIQTTSCFEYGF